MSSKHKNAIKFSCFLTTNTFSYEIISTKSSHSSSFEIVTAKSTPENSSLDEMNKMVSELMNNCAKYETEIEQFNEEKKKYEEQIKKLNKANTEASSYKKKFTELCDRSVNSFEEISKLKKEVEDRKKDIESLKEGHRDAIDKKEKEIAALVTSNKDAEAKYQFYMKKKDKEIETLNANHSNEVLKFQEMLAKKDKEIEGIYSAQKEEFLKYEQIIKDKEIEIEELNEKIEEVRNAPRNEKEIEMVEKMNNAQEQRAAMENELLLFKKKLIALAEAYKELDGKCNRMRDDYEDKGKAAKNRQIELQTSNQILNDELAKLRKITKETIDKLKEAYEQNLTLQNIRSNESKELEALKAETAAQMEKLKGKLKMNETISSSNSIISLEQIKEIISDCLLYQYQLEQSITYNDLIEKTLKSFNQIAKATFHSINASGSISLMHENLKEVYFNIYTQGNPSHGELTGANIHKDILDSLGKQIMGTNVINLLEPKKYINDYMTKLPSFGLDEDMNNAIVNLYLIKRDTFDQMTIAGIETLVKRCTNSIMSDNITIGKKDLFSLKEIYTSSSYIKDGLLYIDNSDLNDYTSEYVIQLIKYPKEKIHTVEFVGTFIKNQLSKKTIKKILCCIFTYLKQVQCLIIRECNLRTNIIDNIAFAIDNLKLLRIVHLQSNTMSNEDIRIICEIMKNNTSCIDFRLIDCNITKSNVDYVSDCISVNKSIKSLLLGSNKIREEGLLSLLKVIGDANTVVDELDLSNNSLREDDYHAIADFISRNPPIRVLTLSENLLNMGNCVLLGSCLNKTSSLKRLNMSNMNIIADFTPVLFQKVNFEELILDDNPLEEIGQIMLAKVLHTNTTLRLLSLKNTKISAFGLTHLLNCIKQNKNFESLHMENNILDENAIVITSAFAKDKNCKIYISKEYVMTPKVTTILEKADNVILV